MSHNGLTLKNHSDIKNFNPEYWKQKLKKRFEHIKTRNNVKRIIGGMKVKVQNSNQNRFNGNAMVRKEIRSGWIARYKNWLNLHKKDSIKITTNMVLETFELIINWLDE